MMVERSMSMSSKDDPRCHVVVVESVASKEGSCHAGHYPRKGSQVIVSSCLHNSDDTLLVQNFFGPELADLRLGDSSIGTMISCLLQNLRSFLHPLSK